MTANDATSTVSCGFTLKRGRIRELQSDEMGFFRELRSFVLRSYSTRSARTDGQDNDLR